jgi:hypothetical protein
MTSLAVRSSLTCGDISDPTLLQNLVAEKRRTTTQQMEPGQPVLSGCLITCPGWATRHMRVLRRANEAQRLLALSAAKLDPRSSKM